MTRARVWFIIAFLLFVPAIVMTLSAAFLPVQAHGFAMLSFLFMIAGLVCLVSGFDNVS